MSRNANSYSIRDRGGNSNGFSEPVEKKPRFNPDHANPVSTEEPAAHGASSVSTPTTQSLTNASSVIYLGNVPTDWNDQIIGSVVAGSGDIVDIRSRLDPSGRSKNFCFIEYSNPAEASKALRLLSEVTLGPRRKFRVELSKEGLRTSSKVERPLLKLESGFKPYYVQLPPEMRTEEAVPGSNSTSVTPNPQSQIKKETSQVPVLPGGVQIPEILLKASTHLPKFNPDTFKADDKVSENLQSIPPTHLIELISTLKNLSVTDINSAQQAFNLTPNIPVIVVQALVLMGLVDIGVINAALTGAQPAQVRHQPVQSIQAQPDPRWPNLPPHTAQKLTSLNPSEAAMIAQVLSLGPAEISNLPAEQRAVVESIRQQYA